MSDQAQPLRDFVAQQNAERLTGAEYLALPDAERKAISDAEFNRLTTADPEHAKYLAKLGRIAETEAVLRKAMEPDYRRLWLDLKRDLEAEADTPPGHKYQRTSSMFSPGGARRVLDRMEQAETLARFKGGV
jgi:hypothetical protein